MKKLLTFTAVFVLAVIMTFSTVASTAVSAADAFDGELARKTFFEEKIFDSEQLKLNDDQMQVYIQNDKYKLYVNSQTGEMALVEIKTNQILMSNPYDVTSRYASGTIAESQASELLSQILLDYTTISSGASASMNSFDEAAMRFSSSGNNQINIKKISGGVRVEYTMGRTETRVLVPRLISKERFETCILEPLKQAAKEHKTTSDGTKAEFLYSKFVNEESGNSVFYTLKDPSNVSESIKRAMYLQYPITEKMPVYVIDSGATQVELVNWLEKAITNFTDYTFEDLAYDHSLTNYTGTDVAPPLFRISIEYYLTDEGLTYRVPANGIRFDSTLYRLNNISILPYLGAGVASEDGSKGGYTFIPDGSGATIDFADVADKSITLSGKIYGQDYSYYNLTGANQEIMRMPVFGTVKTNTVTRTINEKDPVTNEIISRVETTTSSTAVLSIIEEGEAIGTISSKHGGKVNPYNTTYTTYVPRPNDSYALNQFSASSTSMWTVVTDRRYTGNITVKVVMLGGDNANYSGMARAYRDYLTNQGSLTKLTEVEDSVPLFIESFGAIEVTERICGVPVNVKKTLTSYENLKTMISELKEQGVGAVNVKYQAWANDAFQTKPFTTLKLESATGGKKGLVDFLSYANENDVQLYPDVELSYVYYLSLFDGFNYNKMISRKVDKRMATKTVYDDQYQGFMTWQGDVISPQFMSDIWDKIDEKYAKLNIGSISVGYLGGDLNSDQSKKRPLNRVESQTYVENVLAEIKEKVGKVMVTGGNEYALKYASVVVEAPTESSHYIYASAEVPFYGMVVHGSVQFAGQPINSAADYDKAILKTIENGAAPYFRVSYQNTNELKTSTDTSKYFSVDYSIWKDDIVDAYKKVNSVLADLQDKYITEHVAITDKVVYVTYENGVQIYISYDRNVAYIYNDGTKLAVSYEKSEKGKAVSYEKSEDGLSEVAVEHDIIVTLEPNSCLRKEAK